MNRRNLVPFVLGVGCTLILLVVLVVLASSMRMGTASAEALAGYPDAPPPVMAAPQESYGAADDAQPREEAPAKSAMRIGPGGGGRGDAVGLGSMSAKRMAAPKPASIAPERKGAMEKDAPADGQDEGGAAPATRAWFPETFLFEPLVLTNEAGEASVPVKVPDRLTRWRVLALAHARNGEQSGTVTGFQGTLPVYVEPVLPPFLVAGDQPRLPIQLVNTTERAVSGGLSVELTGAKLVESGSGSVAVPAGGSLLRYAIVKAEKPGTAVLHARFGSSDALTRELPVLPAGRPVTDSTGGTLAAPREVSLSPPAEAVPGTSRVRLTVFPGALALVRSELASAPDRDGPADDAYALLLNGRAPVLLSNLGEKADPVSLRSSTLVLQQRALRYGRTPDVATAALLGEAALAHPDNPILSRLGQRLTQQVASAQRPDGTFQGGDGWTLQRLLVATAECTRVVQADTSSATAKQRAAGVAIRASGAFERYAAQVSDGYTAAAILASGAVSGSVADRLREQVLAAIVTNNDGSKSVAVDGQTVRADGSVPPSAEATALAILGLEGDDKAPLADLGASLLGAYTPGYGWGDGRTNLAALLAVLEVFKAPLPAQVRVTLERDGKVVTEGTVSAETARDVVAMEAAAPDGNGAWTVRATPAVPGLGYRLVVQSWVPWTKEVSSGLELSVTGPATYKVGEPALLQLSASGPSGTPWILRTALPAGVQADRQWLETLKGGGQISDYKLEDGAATLTVPPRTAGQPFVASLRVFPTLGGTLNAGASSLEVEGQPQWTAYVPTEAWVVR